MIQGVNPKHLDDYERSSMMGFIAYAQNLDNSCKLLSFNKAMKLNEVQDKNRIFVTGTSIMSTKLPTSKAAVAKVCD